ncbi:MAG: fructosamine kinase family protein [Flavobacteriaceae bacterium]
MEKLSQTSLESLMGAQIQKVVSVSGGDIAQSYLIYTSSDRLFCKYLRNPQAFHMFQCEREGLKAIRDTGTIKAPEVYYCEKAEAGAVLLMEYIESRRPSSSDMYSFGTQLALMHKEAASEFGWVSDNYIGSLKQPNNRHHNWINFYVEQRLEPQLEMARAKGLLSEKELPSNGVMKSTLKEITSDIEPSLLHGDLWSGNYLISTDGVPCLIDPAVYYGHSEVDIAMSRLFGGFQDSFYKAYENVLPSQGPVDDRIKVYQLYYLLVHLNLFGSSYYSGVKAILKSYFY